MYHKSRSCTMATVGSNGRWHLVNLTDSQGTPGAAGAALCYSATPGSRQLGGKVRHGVFRWHGLLCQRQRHRFGYCAACFLLVACCASATILFYPIVNDFYIQELRDHMKIFAFISFLYMDLGQCMTVAHFTLKLSSFLVFQCSMTLNKLH